MTKVHEVVVGRANVKYVQSDATGRHDVRIVSTGSGSVTATPLQQLQ